MKGELTNAGPKRPGVDDSVKFNPGIERVEGELARTAVEDSIQTGNPVSVELKSTGRDSSGDVVSEWSFQWSFLIMREGETS